MQDDYALRLGGSVRFVTAHVQYVCKELGMRADDER